MSEARKASLDKLGPLKEAYTPTGKHEFEITSGQLYIGDPHATIFVDDQEMEELIWDLQDSTKNRDIYFPQGVVINDQNTDWFNVYKNGDIIRLVNADLDDQTESQQAIPHGVGNDSAVILIGDPEALGILGEQVSLVNDKRISRRTILEVPNGKYQISVIARVDSPDPEHLTDYQVINEIIIRRLKEGEKPSEFTRIILSPIKEAGSKIVH